MYDNNRKLYIAFFYKLLSGDIFMEKNIGDKDRAVRIITGAVIFPSAIIGTPFNFAIPGVTGTVIGVVGLWFLMTGSLGTSPLYGLLGINTSKKKAGTAGKSVAVDKSVKKPAARKKAPARKKVSSKRKKK